MTDIWDEQYFAIAKSTLAAPWWKVYLARLFGEETIIRDDEGATITCNRFRGTLYMTGYTRAKIL